MTHQYTVNVIHVYRGIIVFTQQSSHPGLELLNGEIVCLTSAIVMGGITKLLLQLFAQDIGSIVLTIFLASSGPIDTKKY